MSVGQVDFCRGYSQTSGCNGINQVSSKARVGVVTDWDPVG